MSRAGVVAALAREAQVLGPRVGLHEGCEVLGGGALCVVSGMGPSAALAAARRLMDAGAGALISWGMAGGLDPALAAGAVCLPREIIGPDGARFPTDCAWRDALAAALQRPVASGALLTSERPLGSAQAKALAFRATGAEAVDMESAAVAAVAAGRHAPFIAVRVIVDTAADEIPRAVSAAGKSGDVRLGPLVLGLIRAPREIAPLIRLARRYRAAMTALSAIAAQGPVLTGTAGRDGAPGAGAA